MPAMMKTARPVNRAMSSRGSSIAGRGVAAVAPKVEVTQRGALQVRAASAKELRDRIASVNSTKKITEAMKLVAAAKVRRAQEAVVGGRPFSENLVKVLYAVNQYIGQEDVDVPLTAVRPVKSAMLVVITGDRGLCGGFNSFIIRMAEKRYNELEALGVECRFLLVGKKGASYFKNRPQYKKAKVVDMGQMPTTGEAQAIADEVFSSFVSEEVDKVEMVYTKFVSLIAGKPCIQTLLPMTNEGELCDINGKCIDAADDEIFKLTSKEGKFAVERDAETIETASFEGVLTFEQDPNQIMDALLPLYMNSTILRCLQESLASELAARMNAMSSASDNAKELSKSLNLSYNRQRQAKITGEICELVAGAASV